jgi:hypothetical protein
MVVAMASFLFVGCLPGVTPDVDDEEEEEEVVVVTTTVAPVILTIAGISLTGTSEYINATEAAVVIVTGTAPTYSEVKVYIDAVCAGTANVGDTGTFSVVVAEADLGADGDKVIYATAKEAALPVSAHSVEYAFILDQVKPKALTLTATASAADDVDSSLVIGTNPLATLATGGSLTLAAGTWTINCLADSAATIGNVVISDGTTPTTYLITNDADLILDDVIPGVLMTMAPTFSAGDGVTVTVTTEILARATVLFDEEITYASADAATTWEDTTDSVTQTDTFVAYDSKTSYYSFSTILARYNTLRCVVNGAEDLAGNTQTTANVLTCAVGKASTTNLAP